MSVPVRYIRLLPRYCSMYWIWMKKSSVFEFTKERLGPEFEVGRVSTPKTEAGGWFMRDSAPGANRWIFFYIVRSASEDRTLRGLEVPSPSGA